MYHEGMKQTLEQKIKERTERDGECLIWRGSLDSGGYPRLKHEGTYRSVRRLAYGEAQKPHLVSKCGIKLCVNPEHLREQNTPSPLGDTMAEKISNNCEWVDGCMIWKGYIGPEGYANIREGSKSERLHRVAFTELVGDIPEGMHVNHTCWNRACLNVKHLELATNQQNAQYRSGANPNSKTGIRGIHWSDGRKAWIGVVKSNGKSYSKQSSDLTVVKLFVENKREELFGEFSGGN